MPLSTARRTFLTTRPTLIKVGDTIPAEELQENTPGTKVSLADEIAKKGDALIIGVPAAFSGSCSSTHVPSYINHPKTKDFPIVAVVSVNDVFV
jgi:2-Cys peroxiredoxin 5